MNEDLNRKTVKGLSWSMVETMSNYIVKLVVGIILARLLMPEDFGLLAIMMIFVSLSDILVNSGFGNAYIQKKDATDTDANTVFYVNLAISLFLYVLLFVLSPLIGFFFGSEQLPTLIRVMSLAIIISSFNVIQNAIIKRDLNFKKRALLTLVSSLVSGSFGISLAYNGYGVWSLVFQQISNRLIMAILLSYYSNWHPSRQFSKESAKEFFSFGSWIVLTNLLCSAFNNFYKFVFGKWCSTTDLGHYERANQFQHMVAETFTWMFATVAFPVFSKIQDDKLQLQETTRNFVKYSSLAVYPLLICLLIVARPMTIFLLTEKWLPLVPYLQLLCIVGLLSPLTNFLEQILQGTGNTRMYFSFTFLLSTLRIINVLISLRWGISYVIIGDFFCILVSIIIISVASRKLLGFLYISVATSIASIIPVVLISCVVGTATLGITKQYPAHIQFLVPALAFLFTYSVITLLFRKNELEKLIGLLRKK